MFAGLVFAIIVACPAVPAATRVFQQAIQVETPIVPVTGASTFNGCAGPLIAPINPDYEQAVIEQTNAIRMQNGLPPLKKNPDLGNSARYHSADMSATDYFSHDTLNRKSGQLVDVCDTWSRIETYYTNWLALAENIAAGQRTPQEAMNGWMNSPDHRHNILSDAYSEIGVGFYQGNGEYRFYWDQNFGRRDGVFPIVLDGEKAKTITSTVPAYVYGEFTQMRLKNDNGSWSDWVPFKNNFSWTLPDTPGQHTVTAQMHGKDGNVTSSDTIIYQP